MSSLSDDTVLVGDLAAGVIYGVNVTSGNYYPASTDPSLGPDPNPVPGAKCVNGIHVRDSFLYFATSRTNIFGRFPMGSNGAQIGNASVIAHALNGSDTFDDFTSDKMETFS